MHFCLKGHLPLLYSIGLVSGRVPKLQRAPTLRPINRIICRRDVRSLPRPCDVREVHLRSGIPTSSCNCRSPVFESVCGLQKTNGVTLQGVSGRVGRRTVLESPVEKTRQRPWAIAPCACRGRRARHVGSSRNNPHGSPSEGCPAQGRKGAGPLALTRAGQPGLLACRNDCGRCSLGRGRSPKPRVTETTWSLLCRRDP